MPTHDYVIANGTGSSVRSDINDALSAIVSQNSSSTAPATTYAYMIWVDTTTNIVKMRNGANSAWIDLFETDGEFGSKTFNGNITLNAQGDLRFADSDSSNWVAFQAPATVASNVTWTLPSADGTSGQTLQTNGSGTLSWVTPSATVDKIEEGNTSAEVVDTGSDGHFKVTTEGTEALRITAAQRVGIGTNAPSYLLDLLGSAPRIRVKDSSTGAAFHHFENNSGNFYLGIDNSTGGSLSAGNYARVLWSQGAYPLVFATNDTQRAQIDSSGRLLVGTSSGSAQLQVHGQIAIGNGLNGADNNANGGGHVKTTAWSTSGTSHTFSLTSYSAGSDNFSGLVVISGVEKNVSTNGKAATIIGVVNKRYGTGAVFTEISNTKNNMTTFSCSVSSNDLVVSTDSSCRVCITFIGGY